MSLAILASSHGCQFMPGADATVWLRGCSAFILLAATVASKLCVPSPLWLLAVFAPTDPLPTLFQTSISASLSSATCTVQVIIFLNEFSGSN